MAESDPTATPSNDTVSCSFQRTVTLYDWWLVNAKNDFKGKRLAVAGVSSRKDEAMRVFVSAAVIKRFDVFTLETADGKCVIIRGFINEQRTLENGFAAQVFHHFLFGFPPDWESYALDCFREQSTTGSDLGSAVPDNIPASCPEILSDGREKSIPTSSVSPEEASGDHENSLPVNECNVSKEIGWVNVACSSGGKRRSARMCDTKLYQRNKQPGSGGPLKHPNNENSASVTLQNCDVEALRSPATLVQSQSQSEYSNDACVKNSIPTSLASPKEALGDHQKSFPENECNVSKEMGGVNVACSSGGMRRSARMCVTKLYQRNKQPGSGSPLKHPNNENSTSVTLQNCDVEGLKSPATLIQSQAQSVKNSLPTSLASPEEAPGDHQKSFAENECNVSKEMGGVNVACSSGGRRRSASLCDTKLYQWNKQPGSGSPLKHPNNENSTSVTLHNCDVEGLKSPATLIQSQAQSEYSNDACVKNSVPTSLASPEEALGDHQKSFAENECNVSKEMGGVNVACSSGGKRRSAKLCDTKLYQRNKQPSSGGPLKHPNNEHPTSVSLQNCDVEGLKSPATFIQSQLQSEYTNDACVENSISASLASPEEDPGDHQKSFPEKECNVSKEMGVVNVACSSSGGKRRSARLCDVEGLKGPATPIQSQSSKLLTPLHEQLVKKSASRISKTFSPKTEGCYKKKRVTVETKEVGPKSRKLNKSASAGKNPQVKDRSHLTKGSQQKISTVTPESSSFRKSRSGRLLLPPLEFWRNQIPIYNKEHEVTEIQDGASLISPFRGFTPS